PPALFTRVKGYGKLDPMGQAVLRELCLVREELAESRNVPPHRVAHASLLLELSRRRPRDTSTIKRLCRRHPSAVVKGWKAAIDRGIRAEAPPRSELPAAAPRTPRAEIEARKNITASLQKWRRAEAEAREVDLQVVLPGHCVGPLVSAFYEHGDRDGLRHRLVEQVPGLGAFRVERYFEAWRNVIRPSSDGAAKAPNPPVR
ncbi:MAG: HRDC domain-containing protein, partial [Myxococcota bacterium]